MDFFTLLLPCYFYLANTELFPLIVIKILLPRTILRHKLPRASRGDILTGQGDEAKTE